MNSDSARHESAVASVETTTLKSRLAWIDSARGACVIAVVLFHVCLWHYLPLADDAWEPGANAWTTVNGYLGSLRMPVLLALSGMLAARRIGDGWRRPGAAIRAASSYYLYLVWLVVYFAFYLVVSGVSLPHRIDGFGAFVKQLWMPETPLWYVFALALYVVVLTSLRRVPPWLVISALAGLALIVLVTDPNWPMFEKVPENAVYFAVGVYFGPQLQAFAARRRLSDLGLVLAAGLVSILLAKVSFGEVVDSVVDIARNGLFILVGTSVVVNLIRIPAVGRFGEFIGRRTLQIYVLHVPLLLTLLAVLNAHFAPAMERLLQLPAAAVLWPIAVTGVVIVLTLALHRLLVLIRLRLLFEPPKSLTSAISRYYVGRNHSAAADRSPVRDVAPAPSAGSTTLSPRG